jgi:hypothetical protein
MSDLHTLPLLGHDMPEVFPRLREKAQVYRGPEGWHWMHPCAPEWINGSNFPYAAHVGALAGALRHLKECCK